MTNPPVVQVIWRDAFHEFDVNALEDMRDEYLVYTTGFLVDDGQTWVTLAQEILPNGDGYRGVSRIPKAIVHRLDRLRVH